MTQFHPHQSENLAPTDLSDGVHYPVKKESDKTAVPCTFGKVCNWDTVEDSAQTRHASLKNNSFTGLC